MKGRPIIFVLVLATTLLSFRSVKELFPFRISPPPADCALTVDAGAEQVLCAPGPVNLAAVPSENVFSVRWSPGALFSDSTLLTPTATVNTTTTFQVTVRSLLDSNLIVNGNFSQGNTGFTTDYILGTDPGGLGILEDENHYAIDRNPRNTHRRFASCVDHTSGTGNMMVVNGSGQPNNIWCQTLTVKTGTEYSFGAWVMSAVSENPARLQFSVNGALLGSEFVASDRTCDWTPFSEIWFSDTTITAEICIVNVNNSPAGNDFALDDISFREICEATDSVTVTVIELDASWSGPSTLCQNESPVDLNSLLAPAATPGGVWTVDGDTVTVFDPSRYTPGNYAVRYTVEQETCSEENTQTITVNLAPDPGTPTPPAQICNNLQINVELANLLEGETPGGVWTETTTIPSTGNAFDPGLGRFNTDGQVPGTYTFQYSLDAPDPCPDAQATATVIILQPPVADAGEDRTLDCNVDMVTIGSSNTSMGGPFQYEWTAAGGSPIQDPDLPLTEVDQADTYTLTVTDTLNGCNATDQIVVESRITTVTANAKIIPVSCPGEQDGTIIIDDVGGGDPPYQYALNGGPFSSINQFDFLPAGRYTVTVMDDNGCTTDLEVEMEEPNAIAVIMETDLPGDPPLLILGDSTTITVQTNLEPEEIDSVIWDPLPEGCVNCTSAVVKPAFKTTYEVTVINRNGCSETAELTINVERVQRVFVPNAFSPNNDGRNDQFYIFSRGDIRIIRTFQIHNRWGALLYSVQNIPPNDPNYGWDGTYKGELSPQGVYVYFAEVELFDGTTTILKGDVLLVE